jgi:hypothetical protein
LARERVKLRVRAGLLVEENECNMQPQLLWSGCGAEMEQSRVEIKHV